MNLLSFIQQFPHESDCLEYFREIRERVGIKCTECGCKEHKWLAGKSQFQCINCSKHTSINEGTVMENSELPIKYWFVTIHLLTSTHGYINSSVIMKQLGCKESKSVDEMLNRLKLLVDSDNELYEFEGLILACATNQQNFRTRAS